MVARMQNFISTVFLLKLYPRICLSRVHPFSVLVSLIRLRHKQIYISSILFPLLKQTEMKTRDDIFTEVLVRNNRTTTDGFITDTNLKAWYRDAHVWASAYHKWPFSEGRVSTTFTTGGGP